MSKPFAVGSLIVGLVLASAGVLMCQARLKAQDIKPVKPAPIGTINDLDLSPDQEVRRNQRPGIRDRQKWEYKAVGIGLQTLDQLGDDGWELVAVSHDGNGHPQAYLKRQK